MSEIKIEGDYLKINIFTLLDDLKAGDLLRLADYISITDLVIDNVAQQIITGWTALGSHGAMDVKCIPSSPLGKAIREVSKMSGEVAKKEIERMERLSEAEKINHDKVAEWAWEMYHSWPRSGIFSRPELKGDENV